MPKPIIAYYRVSTVQQGASGLGLEGQQAAVQAHANALSVKILGAYTEIESGKKADRPELAKALAHAKRAGATLVIAKLDRLARNVHFLSGLMEAGVEFVCCDNPTANRLTLHILAAVAEDEARRISERTKTALAAYKARGGLLGSARPGAHRLRGGANAKAAKNAGFALALMADSAYADVIDEIRKCRIRGLSYGAIAELLNQKGKRTRRNKAWNHVQVKRVLDRFGEDQP